MKNPISAGVKSRSQGKAEVRETMKIRSPLVVMFSAVWQIPTTKSLNKEMSIRGRSTTRLNQAVNQNNPKTKS